MQKRPRVARLLRCGFAIAQLVPILALAGCSPRGDDSRNGPQVHRDEVRFGLTFEERMAIPPQLSRLRADAQRRANEIYDPFHSREDAARNDAVTVELYKSTRAKLIEEIGRAHV